MREDNLQTRRLFLSNSALALGAVGVSSVPLAIGQGTHQSEKDPNIPTLDTRLKFNPDGSRRPFAGNTVICHLQQQGAARRAVESLAADLRHSSLTPKIAMLPPESYHMTVYPGANDQRRDITGWPSDIPQNASIEECDRIITMHMEQLHLQCQLPLRMKVDVMKTIANPRASTLRMMGADALEEKKIRTIRDRLVEVFHFRDRHHAEYGFHITLAYQLSPFTPTEQTEYHSLLAKHVPLITAAAPVFEFGNPEFCTFPDMFLFNTILLLAT